MKKFVKSIVFLSVLAITFGSVGTVFAQSSTHASMPAAEDRGGRGGFGRGGRLMDEDRPFMLEGILHDTLMAAYADALGLAVDELESRLDNGETMAGIALSTGMSLEDFHLLRTEVFQQALDQAVAEGLLTEEQAEWLASRGGHMSRPGIIPETRRFGRGFYGEGNCLNP